MKPPLHPDVRIGHVHLTVSNLERALQFYRDALGFEVTQRYGTSAVFLSAGGYHTCALMPDNTHSVFGASLPSPIRTQSAGVPSRAYRPSPRRSHRNGRCVVT